MSTGGTQVAFTPLLSPSPNELNRRLISLCSCPIPHGSYLTIAIVHPPCMCWWLRAAKNECEKEGRRSGHFSRVRGALFQGCGTGRELWRALALYTLGEGALDRAQQPREQPPLRGQNFGAAGVVELRAGFEPPGHVCQVRLLLAQHALQRECVARPLERLLVEAIKPKRAELHDHRHVKVCGAGAALLAHCAHRRAFET